MKPGGRLPPDLGGISPPFLTMRSRPSPNPLPPECRRLARRMLTLVATCRPIRSRRNAAGLPGGCLRSPLPAAQSAPAGMPPACPADSYARRYAPPNLLPPECRRLARRILRSSLRAAQSAPAGMPPACPADLTLVATCRPIRSRRNAAGLPGGSYARRYPPPNPLPPNAAGLPGGCLRSSLPAAQSPPAGMPPACPADSYARRYPPPNPLPPECRRLARRILTLVATCRPIASRGMPPACPADSYARRYVPPNRLPPECRRLARRILTLVATRRPIRSRRTNSGGTRRDAQPWRLPGSPGTRQLTLFRWLIAQGGKTRW